MPRRSGFRVDETSVFLNVPFDPGYERLFVTLVAGLVGLGRKPRCVLELPDGGQGRLTRLLDMIRACRVSVHDLSRVGLPVRFNMPFELGLACAVAQLHGRHDFMLFERRPFRIDRTLSDLKGRDPQIHGGTVDGMLSCLLDAFGRDTGNPDIAHLRTVARGTWRFAVEAKRRHHAASVFNRTLFVMVALKAVDFAEESGLL